MRNAWHVRRRKPRLPTGRVLPVSPIIAFLLIAIEGTSASAQTGTPTAGRPLVERIQGRTFPSVFQAWSPAQNVPDDSPLHTVARHDLVFHGPEFFGLSWNRRPTGLADGFTADSIGKANSFRQKLLALNPNLVLIAEIRYRDAHEGYLPEGHKWRLRDKDGRIVPGWDEGRFLCLDFHNPEFCSQVARQAKAAVESGAVDGVMLDWWSDDASRLTLIREVRQAIGDKARKTTRKIRRSTRTWLRPRRSTPGAPGRLEVQVAAFEVGLHALIKTSHGS